MASGSRGWRWGEAARLDGDSLGARGRRARWGGDIGERQGGGGRGGGGHTQPRYTYPIRVDGRQTVSDGGGSGVANSPTPRVRRAHRRLGGGGHSGGLPSTPCAPPVPSCTRAATQRARLRPASPDGAPATRHAPMGGTQWLPPPPARCTLPPLPSPPPIRVQTPAGPLEPIPGARRVAFKRTADCWALQGKAHLLSLLFFTSSRAPSPV